LSGIRERYLRMHRRLHRLDTAIGAVLCALLATLTSIFFAGSPHRLLVPLIFTAVVLLVSMRFGPKSGVFGAIASALVFAAFLFKPFGSLHVMNADARGSLGWMLMLSIPLSYLLAPAERQSTRSRE
jgi:K+-sensing histidine kinase KdpD